MDFNTIVNIIKRAWHLGVFACKSEIRILRNKPLKGNYKDFETLSLVSKAVFKNFKLYNDNTNLTKVKNQKIIRCGFVVYTSSMWNYDKIYHLMEKNDNYIVDIIVVHFAHIDADSAGLEYTKSFTYFKTNYNNVYDATSIDADKYDLLFYQHPSPGACVEKKINYPNVPLNVMLLHSSYSFMLAGNMKKLDALLYHFAYAYYTDTLYYKKLLEGTALYTNNAKFFGFPKMDQFYYVDYKRRSSKRIIIYAPHHSVYYDTYKSATFEDNYLAILELAKKYNDSSFWVYKPHPLLRAHSVKAGIFKSVEEYDEYVKKWDDLENADVVTSGEYFSLFKESDAMITDSVSFLAEYQFTHNPLLLLQSGKQTYNDFGNSLLEVLYKCPGKDILAIEGFIENVISGKDDIKEKREEFFENNLSYRKDSKSANYRIYEDILRFTGKDVQ